MKKEEFIKKYDMLLMPDGSLTSTHYAMIQIQPLKKEAGLLECEELKKDYCEHIDEFIKDFKSLED